VVVFGVQMISDVKPETVNNNMVSSLLRSQLQVAQTCATSFT